MKFDSVGFDPMNYIAVTGDLPSAREVVEVAEQKLGPGGVVGVTGYGDRRFRYIMGQKGGPERVNLGKGAVLFPGYDITVVNGQMVATRDGKVLALNTPSDVLFKGNQPLEETLKKIQGLEGIAIIDSPLLRNSSGMPWLLKVLEQKLFYEEHGKDVGGSLNSEDYAKCMSLVDGIITWRGTATVRNFLSLGINDPNGGAELFYERMLEGYPHLGAIVTSGGHYLDDVGTSSTEIASISPKSESFGESLRERVRGAKLDSCSERNPQTLSGLRHSKDLALFHFWGKLGRLGKDYPERYWVTNLDD